MNGRNLVILTGNIGTQPEARTLEKGSQVVEFRMATNHWYKGNNDQHKERTDWHRVQAWGRTGAFCAEHLRKGDSVQVVGSIRNDVVTHEKHRRVFSSVRAWEVNLLSRRISPTSKTPRHDASMRSSLEKMSHNR